VLSVITPKPWSFVRRSAKAAFPPLDPVISGLTTGVTPNNPILASSVSSSIVNELFNTDPEEPAGAVLKMK